jgi:hypothetical protein
MLLWSVPWLVQQMQFDRLKRREFITLLASTAMTWPRTLAAQSIGARRIGVLMELAADDPQARSNVAALQRGLYKLGWSQGSNLGIDYRWAPDDPVLVWKFAKELVELQPEVIVAHSSPVVATVLGQTRNIPIIFVSISDPIGEGFVASFAHPGGNVTGFTNFESSMTGKWVELLKDIAPEITRVGFLFNPQTTAGGGSYFLRPIDAAASAFKVCSSPWKLPLNFKDWGSWSHDVVEAERWVLGWLGAHPPSRFHHGRHSRSFRLYSIRIRRSTSERQASRSEWTSDNS